MKNVQDWGISRNRYWGTPLNIWQCEDCGEMMSIGSIEELKEKSDNCPDNIELHRPYVDAVTCKCPKCQGTMKRVPEVIDCWFDSGSMPFAQHHYPFENKELFEQQFPAKFISEAVDQTRGWFYSLLAISTLLFNKAPYENVIVLGHVQDADGQKMSKSKVTLLTHLTHYRSMVLTQSVGTSTRIQLLGFLTDSRMSGFQKVREVHGNILEHICILCTVC